MIVNYEEYKALGYEKIPEGLFIPAMVDAEAYAKRITFGRLTEEEESATEENKRGLCRLAELFYAKEMALSESGAPVTSFKNGDYSENYDTSAYTSEAVEAEAEYIAKIYFTPAQLYRGIDYERVQ